MSRLREASVQLGVPATVSIAFVLAVIGGPLLPRSGTLPAAALGTTWIFYAVRALVIFYAVLLLVIPLIRALRGELPVELSMRGARYAEAEVTSTALEALRAEVGAIQIELEQVSEITAVAVRRLTALEEAAPGTARSRE